MQEAEVALIAGGRGAEELMEEVGLKIAQALLARYPVAGVCVAYVGKGNNGGDALVVLRHLRSCGWRIGVRFAFESQQGSELLKKEEEKLRSAGGYACLASQEEVVLFLQAGLRQEEPRVFLDGLVGLGAKGSLSEPCLSLADEINELRLSQGARTWAMDFPSGWQENPREQGQGGCVIADYTACIGGIKEGLLAEESAGVVGRLLPISLRGLELPSSSSSPCEVLEQEQIRSWLPARPYDWYKNKAGKVLIFAGSLGMVGAACLCAQAAIKGGAGMVILGVEESLYALVAGRVLPEIMVLPWSQAFSFEGWADVLIAGPGLGALSEKKEEELWGLVSSFKGKVILDADALNSWAKREEKPCFSERFLLTPHEGEMERLLARRAGESREGWGRRFVESFGGVLLLKGVKTLIFSLKEPLYVTTTGGPAMATAGQGDVLAGLCGALMAQGLSALRGGVLGSYLVGVAMEKSLSLSESEQSFSASSSLEALSLAFRTLRS